MKHLLKLQDLSKEELIEILDLADDLKYKQKNGIKHDYLKGKTLGMIFTKSSTRTRVSFDTGIYQLGGYGLLITDKESQIGRGEPIQDTARVLSRYVDAIMIRTFDQEDVENLAAYGSVPVINGLTDYCHPCQVLADLQTIREYKKNFQGLKLCYVGDGNNMANSLIVGCIKLGIKCCIACPKDFQPDEKIMEWARQNGDFECDSDILKCAQDADVLYTDVWASMGQESQKAERNKVFEKYQINDNVMSVAKNNAIVLHCLPAHREEEISSKVFEDHANEIFDQAENRFHAQKAVMVKLCLDKI